MKNRKIDILGETYTIVEEDRVVENGYDGEARYYQKKIFVRPIGNLLDCSGSDTLSDENERKVAYRELLRHEVLHIFFEEAGSEKWGSDEELVMYPKLNKIYAELGCGA